MMEATFGRKGGRASRGVQRRAVCPSQNGVGLSLLSHSDDELMRMNIINFLARPGLSGVINSG
jgi:hypothetical protein